MAAIINATVRNLRDLLEKGDPRTDGLFLVSSPWPMLGILTIYLYFVRVWGPRWMANRKPFKLDRIIQVYNVLQIIICSYMVYLCYTAQWSASLRYLWICMPVDYSNTSAGREIVFGVWLYYMVKLLDLLDTIFFVLRKKNNQITFLHLYHHTGVVIMMWIAIKYYPGGHGTFLGAINSLVHVAMYSYYLLASIRPEFKYKLWLKKHITHLQIVQFFALTLHNTLCFLASDCQYPKWICAGLIAQNLAMTLLFGEFYSKAYLKKKSV